MANRVAAIIAQIDDRIYDLSANEQEKLDSDMSIDFREHYAYQNAQVSAHASGKITADEAFIVYRALGEVYSESNGGWNKHATTAIKCAVTKLMAELIGSGIR